MVERLKPLRGEGAKLLKLVTEAQDIETLTQALELGQSLGQPAEGLLDGVGVTATGELLLSSRFRGSQADQPALNLLLMQQLSMALNDSPEAKIRCAVRRLDLVCALVPVLRGFDSLESLTLQMLEGVQWHDLSNFGPLNALRQFSVIHGHSKDNPCHLKSLDGLQAPNLEVLNVSRLGLSSVDDLKASRCLMSVDLSHNPGLQSIGGLKSSAPSLEKINFEACHALLTIEPLKGATSLQSINLKDCVALQNLKALSDSQSLVKINLEGCAQIDSLEGLASSELQPWQYKIFSLKGCAGLVSLRHLPTLSKETSSLCLEEMPMLASLEGIEAACSIETLEIENTAVTHLGELERIQSLADLRVIDCTVLKDISVLGQLQSLHQARLLDCPQINNLPSQWGSNLRCLEFTAGSFTAIGQMPQGLEELELCGVPTLQQINGVETARSLKFVAVDSSLKDASALQGLPNAYLRCFQMTASQDASTWLHLVAGRLNPLRLDLIFSNLKELPFLVDFPQLQAVKVGYQAQEFYQLKGTDFTTEAAVRTLQRAICKKHQLQQPDFLKAKRTSNQAALESGPSLADLKRGLTSTDFGQILDALQLLRTTSSPSLYDAIVEGVDALSLYTGDTKSLGKIFKDIHAPYRTWARWALTHVLMDAPEGATRAVAVREKVETIVLTISLSHGQDASRPMQLSQFKSLKSITLLGISGNDLSFLSDVGPLSSLKIVDMDELTSLETLSNMAALPTLQSLTIQRCPAMISLQGLENASGLHQLVVDGVGQLCDFSAMNGMHSLKSFPNQYRSEYIDITNFTAQNNIQFAAGLKSATSLYFKLTGRVDFSPLAGLKTLLTVKLELDTLDQDFSPLENIRSLEITLVDPKTGYTITSNKKPKPEHHYVWTEQFLQLERLDISGGTHDFSHLKAPRLTAFHARSRVPSLVGVGHVSDIYFHMSECQSLEGLEDSPLESLDIYYNIRDRQSLPSVKVIHKLKNLKKLRIGPELTALHAKELLGCVNVQRLDATGFTGSLAFLKGWSQLVFLDLRNSGELTNLEILSELPSLTEIRLRGSVMKRETWPKALQDRLSFKS